MILNVAAKDVVVGMVFLDSSQFGDEIKIARIETEDETFDFYDEDGNILVGIAAPDELIEIVVEL